MRYLFFLILALMLVSCGDDIPSRNQPRHTRTKEIQVQDTLSSGQDSSNSNTNTVSNVTSTKEFNYYTTDFKSFTPTKISVSRSSDSIKFNDEAFFVLDEKIYNRPSYITPIVTAFSFIEKEEYTKIGNIYYTEKIIARPKSLKISANNNTTRPRIYTVEGRDTWWSISKKVGITVSKLKERYGHPKQGMQIIY